MIRNFIIKQDFFKRKTLVVAKDLLGKYLVRKLNGNIIREKITEVEAYVGPHDLACHSSRGRTPRCEPMFMEAGTIYVYFTYGMHWMLNIVSENSCGAAVLIRGTEDVSGPARLTKKIQKNKRLNGKKLGKKTGVWIEDGEKVSPKKIIRTPRIRISYSGEIWTNKPYRFILKD